jgi:hypothetical protein
VIDLTKETLHGVIKEGQHVWPLKITANSIQEGLSSSIFVFHAALNDDLYEGDVFEAVASVQQITDIPENAAGVDSNGELCPYYRSDNLTFYARSPAEAEDLWDAIVEDVDDLTRNWAALSNLQSDGVTSSTITIKENLNAGARDVINVEKLGFRTLTPEVAIDIDPDGTPTTEGRGIRMGGDVSFYRTGTNTATIDAALNIQGSLLINGLPIEGTTQSYTHQQASPSSLWSVTHNLGFLPNVRVVDTAGNTVICAVSYTNSTALQLDFNGYNITGTAYFS